MVATGLLVEGEGTRDSLIKKQLFITLDRFKELHEAEESNEGENRTDNMNGEENTTHSDDEFDEVVCEL